MTDKQSVFFHNYKMAILVSSVQLKWNKLKSAAKILFQLKSRQEDFDKAHPYSDKLFVMVNYRGGHSSYEKWRDSSVIADFVSNSNLV